MYKTIFSTMLIVVSVSGCGIKGPLYLPDEQAAKATTEMAAFHHNKLSVIFSTPTDYLTS